jgi:AraC-like DNA-binding protein
MGNLVRNNLFDGSAAMEIDHGGSIISIVFGRILDLAITDIKMFDSTGSGPGKKPGNDGRTGNVPGISLKTRTTIETRIEGLVTIDEEASDRQPDINELKLRIRDLLLETEKVRFGSVSAKALIEKNLSHDSIDEVFMRKIYRIITDNVKDLDFDVGMLQDKMNMSRVQLYRKIKALTGVSPGTVIHRHRMQRAAELIQGKAGNLAEISLSVGFTNPSYFSKRFREYYGSSPRAFFKSTC